tara:strand:- start:367 stop:609 length:243 start_codon:yes stop_codon:yes gene_type:complete
MIINTKVIDIKINVDDGSPDVSLFINPTSSVRKQGITKMIFLKISVIVPRSRLLKSNVDNCDAITIDNSKITITNDIDME